MNNDIDDEWIDPHVTVQLIGGPYCGEWRECVRGLEIISMMPKPRTLYSPDPDYIPTLCKSLTYRHMLVWYKEMKVSFMVYNELTTDEALQIVSKYTGWPYVPQQ